MYNERSTTAGRVWLRVQNLLHEDATASCWPSWDCWSVAVGPNQQSVTVAESRLDFSYRVWSIVARYLVAKRDCEKADGQPRIESS